MFCFDERKVIHYPSLKTVLMIESAIREKGEFKNKRVLWQSFSNRIMYQTLLVVLDYLVHSNKVLVDKDGSVIWIWNPEFVENVLKSGARKL
jgi:hypothetical protein